MEGPTIEGAVMEAASLAVEQERHHWLLRGDRRWKAVAGTNCIGATKAQSICVRAEK